MTPAQLITFEAQHPHHTPTKTQAIRNQLGMSDIRYYANLNRAAHTTEGIAADPITARRIRERAQARAQERAARTGAA